VIRQARPEDRSAVEAVVVAAYSMYVERIGKPPGPMLDDYRRLIDDGVVSVAEEPGGAPVALIVLLPRSDHLLLDNIAVRPDRQGRGVGRRLIAFAASEAQRRGYSELRLYTHATMTENIALYERLGSAETGRGYDGGYDRVFMSRYFP